MPIQQIHEINNPLFFPLEEEKNMKVEIVHSKSTGLTSLNRRELALKVAAVASLTLLTLAGIAYFLNSTHPALIGRFNEVDNSTDNKIPSPTSLPQDEIPQPDTPPIVQSKSPQQIVRLNTNEAMEGIRQHHREIDDLIADWKKL